MINNQKRINNRLYQFSNDDKIVDSFFFSIVFKDSIVHLINNQKRVNDNNCNNRLYDQLRFSNDDEKLSLFFF